MSSHQDITRYRAYMQAEIDAAAIYRTLAKVEKQPQLAELYGRLAAEEERHAEYWAQRVSAMGGQVGSKQPSWRAKGLSWLAGRFGPQFALPAMMRREQMNTEVYDTQPDEQSTAMAAAERSHARILQALSGTEASGVEGGTLARMEGRHHGIGGNALRAAVLGANDGLVSNLSLVMGVAGASLSPHAILITGCAGLLAGACSMAMGEWLSVQSSRELYQRQIEIEQNEIAEAPEEETQELALIYQSRGLSEEKARALAAGIMADKEKALDTLARDELGIDPEELGGSAWEAAIASFALFAVGAIMPVLPFFIATGRVAVIVSLVVSSVALFAIGAAITLLTGRSVLMSGMRQVVIGLGAAGLTYGIGRLIGVTITG